MNELIEKEFYDVISKKDIELIKKFDEIEKRAKAAKEMLKYDVYEFLKKNDLLEKGYTQDGIRFSYKKAYTKKQIDTNELKKQGLYEQFLKEVKCKDSVSISVVYEDDEDDEDD